MVAWLSYNHNMLSYKVVIITITITIIIIICYHTRWCPSSWTLSWFTSPISLGLMNGGYIYIVFVGILFTNRHIWGESTSLYLSRAPLSSMVGLQPRNSSRNQKIESCTTFVGPNAVPRGFEFSKGTHGMGENFHRWRTHPKNGCWILEKPWTTSWNGW